MNFDIGHIFASMSPLSKVIALTLVLMAVASVAVTVERYLAFLRATHESQRFAKNAAASVEDWDPEQLIEIAKRHSASPMARLLAATLARYLESARRRDCAVSPVQLARNEAERQKELISGELGRGMGVLATVGSIAPFVGLLGTVVGIIAAFQGIAATGSGGISAVSAGIAEALVETALGLMVAIPAVIMFNLLSTRIAAIQLRIARSTGELMDELESRYGTPDAQAIERHAA